MMLMIELYWTYASYCVLIHIFPTWTRLHNTYKRTLNVCFHYWVVSHSLISFYLALILISFSQFTVITGRFRLYRVSYYCTILTKCSIMGHGLLWTLHWVNFCIIWTDLTQFSLKMNNCGTSHGQISPVNLVSKCSQASCIIPHKHLVEMLQYSILSFYCHYWFLTVS